MGDYSPTAPTDPDVPNSGIRLLSLDALRGVDAMNHPRRWQGKALEQTREVRPVQAGLVGAAIEPFVPAPRDFVAKGR